VSPSCTYSFSDSGLWIFHLKWQVVHTCIVTFMDAKRLQTDRQDITKKYVQVDGPGSQPQLCRHLLHRVITLCWFVPPHWGDVSIIAEFSACSAAQVLGQRPRSQIRPHYRRGRSWLPNPTRYCKPNVHFPNTCTSHRPPLWSSGQSFWLQILRSRVRFPVLPDFLRSTGSGTGSTQPREDNWGATWR
jgi:hypothetical protein